MSHTEFLYLVIWLVISGILSIWMYKKTAIFKRFWGILIVLLVAILLVLAHNFISHLIQAEEAVCFLAAILSIGILFFLLCFWVISIIRAIIRKFLVIGTRK